MKPLAYFITRNKRKFRQYFQRVVSEGICLSPVSICNQSLATAAASLVVVVVFLIQLHFLFCQYKYFAFFEGKQSRFTTCAIAIKEYRVVGVLLLCYCILTSYLVYKKQETLLQQQNGIKVSIFVAFSPYYTEKWFYDPLKKRLQSSQGLREGRRGTESASNKNREYSIRHVD